VRAHVDRHEVHRLEELVVAPEVCEVDREGAARLSDVFVGLDSDQGLLLATGLVSGVRLKRPVFRMEADAYRR
jgi:hypothetical protein